jgi:hypothetical protein
VLICQIGQDGKADVVLGKALRVLPKTELLKPVSDLLPRAGAPGLAGFIRLHLQVYPMNPHHNSKPETRRSDSPSLNADAFARPWSAPMT